MIEARLITATEVAQRLGISHATLRRMVGEQNFPYILVGKSKRFQWPAINEWFAKQQEKLEKNTCPCTNQKEHRTGTTISPSVMVSGVEEVPSPPIRKKRSPSKRGKERPSFLKLLVQIANE